MTNEERNELRRAFGGTYRRLERRAADWDKATPIAETGFPSRLSTSSAFRSAALDRLHNLEEMIAAFSRGGRIRELLPGNRFIDQSIAWVYYSTVFGTFLTWLSGITSAILVCVAFRGLAGNAPSESLLSAQQAYVVIGFTSIFAFIAGLVWWRKLASFFRERDILSVLSERNWRSLRQVVEGLACVSASAVLAQNSAHLTGAGEYFLGLGNAELIASLAFSTGIVAASTWRYTDHRSREFSRRHLECFYDEVIDARGGTLPVWHVEAKRALAAGEVPRAAKLLNDVPRGNRTREFWVLAIRTLMCRGNYEAVIDNYRTQRAFFDFLDSSRVTYLVASAYIHQDHCESAIQLIDEYLARDQVNGRDRSERSKAYLWVLRGFALNRLGEHEAAKASEERAQALDENCRLAKLYWCSSVALLHIEKGTSRHADLDRALRLCQEAKLAKQTSRRWSHGEDLMTDDPYWMYKNVHGLVLMAMKRHDDARKQFISVLERNRNFSLTYVNLGLLYEKTGRIRRARITYYRAIMHERTRSKLVENLAMEGLERIDERPRQFKLPRGLRFALWLDDQRNRSTERALLGVLESPSVPRFGA